MQEYFVLCSFIATFATSKNNLKYLSIMRKNSATYTFLRSCYHWASNMGIDLVKTYYFFKGIIPFFRDRKMLKKQLKNQTDFRLGMSYPCLSDRFDSSGTIKGAYFHQDLLIAQRIYEAKPDRHLDVGSRIDGFIAHVAVFCKIEVIDIREQKSNVENIICRQADLMQLPEDLIESCDSISSLHAIEHFGLGRYTDPVDADGHIKAIHNIHRMLKTGGMFYFSVPLGPQRIEFNAHRIFSITYLLGIFDKKFQIDRFSYVDDQGDLHKHITLTDEMINNNCHCRYGCAIFELKKL
jgi:SAM-dependent methyltransferase